MEQKPLDQRIVDFLNRPNRYPANHNDWPGELVKNALGLIKEDFSLANWRSDFHTISGKLFDDGKRVCEKCNGKDLVVGIYINEEARDMYASCGGTDDASNYTAVYYDYYVCLKCEHFYSSRNEQLND